MKEVGTHLVSAEPVDSVILGHEPLVDHVLEAETAHPEVLSREDEVSSLRQEHTD